MTVNVQSMTTSCELSATSCEVLSQVKGRSTATINVSVEGTNVNMVYW